MKENSRGQQTMEFMGREYRLESEHLGYKEAEAQRKEFGNHAAIDNRECGNGQCPDCWRVWKLRNGG